MSRYSPIPARAATLRNWTLGLAGLAAAALLAPATANAAECVNGYMKLPNQVILLCGAEHHASPLATLTAAPAAPPASHAPVAEAEGHSIMADGIASCHPGMYRSFANPSSGTQIIPC
jgi:hypothetical protein